MVEISSSISAQQSPPPRSPSISSHFAGHTDSYGSSGDTSSSPLDDEDDTAMSEDDHPPQTQQKQQKERQPSLEPKTATLPTSSSKSVPASASPMFLNFKRDLSLKVSKPSKDKGKPKVSTTYKVNGVNILNKSSVDGKTVIERQKQRRVRHNNIERLRRDTINKVINELSNIVPDAVAQGEKPNKGNVLKLTLEYVKRLQAENKAMHQHLDAPRDHSPAPLPPLPRPLHLEIPSPHAYVGGRSSSSPISPSFSTYSGYSASSDTTDRQGWSPNLSPVVLPEDHVRRLSGSVSPLPHSQGPVLPSISLHESPPTAGVQMHRSHSHESHYMPIPTSPSLPTYHNGPPTTPSQASISPTQGGEQYSWVRMSTNAPTK